MDVGKGHLDASFSSAAQSGSTSNSIPLWAVNQRPFRSGHANAFPGHAILVEVVGSAASISILYDGFLSSLEGEP
jgi:hypothetical protein